MSNLTISANDGSGEFSAYIARPSVTPAPAIIVIQEIFGVNKDMRQKCDDLAAQGYVAVSPDLFWRQEPNIQLTDKSQEEWDKAFALYNGFDVDKGVDDINAVLSALQAHEDVSGKIGAIGYCLGGKLAYLTATRTNISAAVGYYGVEIDKLTQEAVQISSPLMLHIAENDQFVDKAAQKTIHDALGAHDQITLHSYANLDHAFARIDGEHYDEAGATLANQRTADFLSTHLKD